MTRYIRKTPKKKAKRSLRRKSLKIFYKTYTPKRFKELFNWN